MDGSGGGPWQSANEAKQALARWDEGGRRAERTDREEEGTDRKVGGCEDGRWEVGSVMGEREMGERNHKISTLLAAFAAHVTQHDAKARI